jgi:hypothetical protein
VGESRLSWTESRSSEALDQCRQAIVVGDTLFVNGVVLIVRVRERERGRERVVKGLWNNCVQAAGER